MSSRRPRLTTSRLRLGPREGQPNQIKRGRKRRRKRKRGEVKTI
jgi:hypothetical protein